MARRTASCASGPTLSGNSSITNLVINGSAITVTGSPNQTVTLPNGTATINAHVSSVSGTAGELAVTAVRVMTYDTITGQPIADVLLSTVDAKIDCQGSSSTTEEWVTGGGWIVGQNGWQGHVRLYRRQARRKRQPPGAPHLKGSRDGRHHPFDRSCQPGTKIIQADENRPELDVQPFRPTVKLADFQR